MNKTIGQLADELLLLYKEKCLKPFPYDDCRKLRCKSGDRYENLIPDLDLYFSDIAGYCSWGKRILSWPKGKLGEVREKLGKSFFEKHPAYKPLKSMITEADTPELYAELSLYETMRKKLLELLSLILSEQHGVDPPSQTSDAF